MSLENRETNLNDEEAKRDGLSGDTVGYATYSSVKWQQNSQGTKCERISKVIHRRPGQVDEVETLKELADDEEGAMQLWNKDNVTRSMFPHIDRGMTDLKVRPPSWPPTSVEFPAAAFHFPCFKFQPIHYPLLEFPTMIRRFRDNISPMFPPMRYMDEKDNGSIGGFFPFDFEDELLDTYTGRIYVPNREVTPRYKRSRVVEKELTTNDSEDNKCRKSEKPKSRFSIFRMFRRR